MGKPNSVVLSELARCSFAVDQVYSDTPMATFAREAALLGKPAVVAGYGQEEFRRMFPPEQIPPAQYCRPEDLDQVIERLVVDGEYRLELGKRARRFVESQWSARSVAQRYLQVISGNVPRQWVFDPRDIRYLHGFGLPESRAKDLVRAVIEVGGIEALQLSDKPELERMFAQFAR